MDDITGRKRSFSSLQRLRPVRRPHLILVSSAISSTIFDSQRGTLETIDPYFSVPHFFCSVSRFCQQKNVGHKNMDRSFLNSFQSSAILFDRLRAASVYRIIPPIIGPSICQFSSAFAIVIAHCPATEIIIEHLIENLARKIR